MPHGIGQRGSKRTEGSDSGWRPSRRKLIYTDFPQRHINCRRTNNTNPDASYTCEKVVPLRIPTNRSSTRLGSVDSKALFSRSLRPNYGYRSWRYSSRRRSKPMSKAEFQKAVATMPKPIAVITMAGRSRRKTPASVVPHMLKRIKVLGMRAKLTAQTNDLKELGVIAAELKKHLTVNIPGTGKRMPTKLYRVLKSKFGSHKAKIFREAYRYGAVRYGQWTRNTKDMRKKIAKAFATTSAKALLDKVIQLSKKAKPTAADKTNAKRLFVAAHKALAADLAKVNIPATFGYGELIGALKAYKLKVASTTLPTS